MFSFFHLITVQTAPPRQISLLMLITTSSPSDVFKTRIFRCPALLIALPFGKCDRFSLYRFFLLQDAHTHSTISDRRLSVVIGL